MGTVQLLFCLGVVSGGCGGLLSLGGGLELFGWRVILPHTLFFVGISFEGASTREMI